MKRCFFERTGGSALKKRGELKRSSQFADIDRGVQWIDVIYYLHPLYPARFKRGDEFHFRRI